MKNLSSKSALLIPTVSTSAFHSTNLFWFSRHHIPINSVAPLPAYKQIHNPQFLQLLWRGANARNVSFFTLYGGQFMSVVNTNLPFFQLRMWLSKSHREDEVLTAFKGILEWSSPNQDEISLQKCHLPVEVCQLISDEDLGKNKFDLWKLKHIRNSREKQHYK